MGIPALQEMFKKGLIQNRNSDIQKRKKKSKREGIKEGKIKSFIVLILN